MSDNNSMVLPIGRAVTQRTQQKQCDEPNCPIAASVGENVRFLQLHPDFLREGNGCCWMVPSGSFAETMLGFLLVVDAASETAPECIGDRLL
mmetsp:Transcript_24350/g.57334  ORF Transcript_24350/g.57334 Transcript_24350/m.57334 type:complete len:92 (+) Transcript_24350:396-671(+)